MIYRVCSERCDNCSGVEHAQRKCPFIVIPGHDAAESSAGDHCSCRIVNGAERIVIIIGRS